jgi:hypothetical protein
MVSSAEKYAREIKIFTLSRGIGAQISRSDVLKKRFQRSAWGQPEKTDFFNRIDPKLTLASLRNRADVEGNTVKARGWDH